MPPALRRRQLAAQQNNFDVIFCARESALRHVQAPRQLPYPLRPTVQICGPPRLLDNYTFRSFSLRISISRNSAAIRRLSGAPRFRLCADRSPCSLLFKLRRRRYCRQPLLPVASYRTSTATRRCVPLIGCDFTAPAVIHRPGQPRSTAAVLLGFPHSRNLRFFHSQRAVCSRSPQQSQQSVEDESLWIPTTNISPPFTRPQHAPETD
ncbi:hypothetical protein L596_008200 [Steinernema carpocapsae]|uniref:Uncharacterized protein n=1 Tax=Steinernema carpocapsae TaxID=34508 RepID=A0A4V6A695_STECR|nr:hypothetical protein L596_008200 [Steinernema carpocapsae]